MAFNKTFLSTIFLVVFALYSLHTQGQQLTVSIAGSPAELSRIDSAAWQLEVFESGQFTLLDKATSDKDKATFALQLKAPAYCRLKINSLSPIDLLLNPAEKNISLAGNYVGFYTGNYIFFDSPENQCMLQYKREELDFNKLFNYALTNQRQYESTSPDFMWWDSVVNDALQQHNSKMRSIAESYPGTFCAGTVIPNRIIPALSENKSLQAEFASNDAFLRKHFFDKLNLRDSVLLSLPSFFDLVKAYHYVYMDTSVASQKYFIGQLIGDTAVSMPIRKYLYGYYLQDAVRQFSQPLVNYMLNGMSIPDLDNERGDLKLVEALRKILPGNKATDFELPDVDGKSVKLSSVAAASAQTLLMFYSHDCEHCLKTIPLLVDKMKAKPGLKVYAVDINPDQAGWKKYVSENHLPFTNVRLTDDKNAALSIAYVILGTPTMVLMDNSLTIKALYPTVQDL